MLSIGKQLTPEQRLSKSVVDIMGNPKYVALAGILMIGERSVDATKGSTACTNGRDEWYNPDFIDTLTDAELRFLVLHECYHKLYRHLTTWKHLYDKDAQKANMACDYVINCKLIDDNTDGFAKMPECGLFDPQYRGMDSAQVFNALPENNSSQDSSGGPGASDGMDTHDWDGAQELTASEQRELARDIDEAIRQGALIAGKMGSGGDRDIEALLQPQIDWREALRDFIQTTCAGNDYSTWARPNRRYRTAGVYLPSGISEQVGELVLAIDTSASVGQRELTAFLTEVQSICDTVHPECVRVLYWDTEVCGDEKYETHELDNLAKTTKPRGGGGTVVDCVPKYIADNNITPQAVIVLTDGYVGSWGNWHHPVLWTILDNNHAKPDVGTYVNIKSGDM